MPGAAIRIRASEWHSSASHEFDSICFKKAKRSLSVGEKEDMTSSVMSKELSDKRVAVDGPSDGAEVADINLLGGMALIGKTCKRKK